MFVDMWDENEEEYSPMTRNMDEEQIWVLELHTLMMTIVVVTNSKKLK
jgi:hypothetical protein